jgi:glycosyltransferase involved in cell wall biosynthesis
LQSLLNQKCLPAEIIVVDNAPNNDSTKIVVERYNNAVTYHREIRHGLDIARNAGARLAKFPIIAYTNDDVNVHPLWTYRIWEIFSQSNIQAMTGLAIASVLDTESLQIFEKHGGLNKGYKEKCYNKEFLNPKINSIWPVFNIGAGANMAFRKTALEKVNFFDERLDAGAAAGCYGDSEIWYKILQEGMIMQYNPRAVVFHAHRKEIAHLKKQVFNYMWKFVTSLLIQNEQNKQSGYKRNLYFRLP